MDELVKSVLTAPVATIFIIAGMVFLFIAVVGKISGKIEPGKMGRFVSAVVGIAFITAGLIMHQNQKPPGVSSQTKSVSLETSPQKSTPGSQIPKQEPTSSDQPSQKKDALNSPIQTRFDGIVVSIIRFEKTGGLVMLQLMARNTSGPLRTVCFYPRSTNLIHEATGESWQPKEYTGQECTRLEANKSSHIWMRFNVAEPENKIFSLSSPLFNETLDNLVLAKSS